MLKRNICGYIDLILKKYTKMAFISGPRQTGKTTLAKSILRDHGEGVYFNWDIIKDQKKLIKNPYFFEDENRNINKKFLVIFDEIHKYSGWKNYLKGVYDGYSDDFLFMITGSGRLDLFKKGGDSLFGRYFAVNLFPFSVGEVMQNVPDWKTFLENLKYMSHASHTRKIYEQLFKFSGFPEPFIRNSQNFYNIWFQERKKLLIREDIKNAYALREISNMEILSNILPDKIGSPLSINSLREDISVSYDSIKNYLLILEQFYYFFKITPFSKSIARALKKEPKIYLYDWVEVSDDSKRFENIAAFHLYKAISLWKSMGQANVNLFYVRDKEKREVDFLITEKDVPIILIETKFNDDNISENLLLFQIKLKVPVAIQLVHKKDVCKKMKRNTFVQWIVSADRFFGILP